MSRGSNTDLLRCFDEEELHLCGACREKARVAFPEVAGSFCLACDAITIEGVRFEGPPS